MSVDNKETFERLRSQMATVFGLDVADISQDTQFGDFPQWDSIGHMDLLVMLESEFGVPVNADTISELVSVQAILDFVGTKAHD